MKIKPQNSVYFQQKRNEVLRVLAILYFDNQVISWNQILSVATFLYRNSEFGPKETKDVAKYLVRINNFLTDNIADYYLNQKVRDRMKSEFIDRFLINESKVLQYERILKKLPVDQMEDEEDLERKSIPFLLKKSKGINEFQTLDFMTKQDHYPLFHLIASTYENMQKVIEESEVYDSEISVYIRLMQIKRQMDAAIIRMKNEEKKSFLQNYIKLIEHALSTYNIVEMERLCNGVIVRKKENKEKKLA